MVFSFVSTFILSPAYFYAVCNGGTARLVNCRAGGMVWAGWARAHPLFRGNRVKHMVGPTHFQNASAGPELIPTSHVCRCTFDHNRKQKTFKLNSPSSFFTKLDAVVRKHSRKVSCNSFRAKYWMLLTDQSM